MTKQWKLAMKATMLLVVSVTVLGAPDVLARAGDWPRCLGLVNHRCDLPGLIGYCLNDYGEQRKIQCDESGWWRYEGWSWESETGPKPDERDRVPGSTGD